MERNAPPKDPLFEEFSIVEKKLNDYLKRNPKVVEAYFATLSLLLMREERFPLLEIFRALGPKGFSVVCNILAGKTVRFPSKEELRGSLMWALAFYLKEVRGLGWGEIEGELGSSNLPTLKYGIRNRYMSAFLQQKTKEILQKAFDEVVKEGGT